MRSLPHLLVRPQKGSANLEVSFRGCSKLFQNGKQYIKHNFGCRFGKSIADFKSVMVMLSSMSWTLMRSLRPLAKEAGISNCKGSQMFHHFVKTNESTSINLVTALLTRFQLWPPCACPPRRRPVRAGTTESFRTAATFPLRSRRSTSSDPAKRIGTAKSSVRDLETGTS